MSHGPAQSRGAGFRRGYIDWLRGVAVLVMIEAHLIDSWTRSPDRETEAYGWSMILGGFGAPLFLFLAGVAVPMSAGSKARRSGDVGDAVRAVVRRGLEVLALAFLFRAQSLIFAWAPWRELLKVDILNIMGPSIVAAALLWGMAKTTRTRLILFGTSTIALSLVTPIVRTHPLVRELPDALGAYIQPVSGLSNFTLFPWAGFVFAGGMVGVLLDSIRMYEPERRANAGLLAGGLSMSVAVYFLSFLPSLYPSSSFWTTSPSFFFLRVGILTAAVGVAYFWELRPGGPGKWSPLRQLGVTSLFVYWVHTELVYGWISMPLHKRFTLSQAWIVYACFCGLMLWLSIAKDKVVESRKVEVEPDRTLSLSG